MAKDEQKKMSLVLQQCTPSFLVPENEDDDHEPVMVCGFSTTLSLKQYEDLLATMENHGLEVSFD